MRGFKLAALIAASACVRPATAAEPAPMERVPDCRADEGFGQSGVARFKTLHGTGFGRLDTDGKVERVGGVKWTIKDGIVYDARQLLADVAAMVEAQKRAGPAGSR